MFRLIERTDVRMWLRGDTSFLGEFPQASKAAARAAAKAAEDEWGRALMKEVRPDLKMHKQWTNLFGEMICRELYLKQGKEVTKPRNIEGQEPDWETPELILEAKIGTHFTDGTAHEKVMGVLVKYSEVPARYGKPLRIVCMGRAEQEMFGKYKVGSPDCAPGLSRLLACAREMGIDYVAATSLLD